MIRPVHSPMEGLADNAHHIISFQIIIDMALNPSLKACPTAGSVRLKRRRGMVNAHQVSALGHDER